MPITPLPTPPSRQDPTNFSARADAFLAALPTMVEQLNAATPGDSAYSLAMTLGSTGAGQGASVVARVGGGTVQDAFDTASGKGAEVIPSKRTAIAGAVSLTVGKRLDLQVLMADEAGVVGDGTADDTTACAVALVAAQLTGRNLKFRPGSIIKLTSTWVFAGAAVAILGEPDAPLQQGSARPPVTFRWHGGAAPMFRAQSSGWSFVGFAAENFGTATDWLEVTNSQHLMLRDLSFVMATGVTRFSRSIIYTAGNNFGYSQIWHCHCLSAAPKFLYIDGLGSSNGVTPIEIGGRCLFESNSAGRMDVVYVTDENLDALHIHDCTFNQQANELTIVNMETGALDPSCTDLSIHDIEMDTAASGVSDRYFRLTNVRNSHLYNLTCNGGGAVTAIANLTNSVVHFHDNYWERVNGFFFAADSVSRVYVGPNNPNVANTKGVVNDSALGSGLYPLTYGTTVTILGHLARQGEVFRVDVTNGSAWALSFVHPGISGNGYFTRGQVFGLQIRNVSGGAMGTVTPVAGYFKLAGGALPIPTNGNSHTIWLMWDGTYLVEVGRTPTQVPN